MKKMVCLTIAMILAVSVLYAEDVAKAEVKFDAKAKAAAAYKAKSQASAEDVAWYVTQAFVLADDKTVEKLAIATTDQSKAIVKFITTASAMAKRATDFGELVDKKYGEGTFKKIMPRASQMVILYGDEKAEVKEEGDRATVTLITPKRLSKEPMFFKQVEGKWFWDVDQTVKNDPKFANPESVKQMSSILPVFAIQGKVFDDYTKKLDDYKAAEALGADIQKEMQQKIMAFMMKDAVKGNQVQQEKAPKTQPAK